MVNQARLAVVLFGIVACAARATPPATACAELNDGWRFVRDEPLAAMREFGIPAMLDWLDDMGRDLLETPRASRRPVGAELMCTYVKPDFNDRDWEPVHVPHDAGIACAFSYDRAPFDGYLAGTGSAWYRYSFTNACGRLSLPDGGALALPEKGKLLFTCDGAMAYPMLWLNGRFVGGWPNGYMHWRVDITPYLVEGRNVIAVRTYRPGGYARWHTGLGLTRRCRLVALPEDHIVPDSVCITTPEVTRERATVHVTYECARSGRKQKMFTVEKPRLWDVDDPHLYTLKIEGETFRYGIRTVKWTADDGFHLNGRRVQLRGFCFHQDLCSLGSVANRTAIRRRLLKAKECGMNAVRMSHYPHAEEWYDLCDELGILVMDELTDAWGLAKLPNDYHVLFERWHERDLRSWIRHNRNHPSIAIWSLGNEIWESRSGTDRWPIYQRNGMEMVRLAHQEDPTRPTTTANDNAAVWRSPYAQFTDVFGFNYRPDCYAEYHTNNPAKPIVATETVCTISSRGEYQLDNFGKTNARFGVPSSKQQFRDYHSTSYGLHSIILADYEFAKEEAAPYVAGCFVWTAFDYFGSPAVLAVGTLKPLFSDPERQARAYAERMRYGRPRAAIHSCATGIFDLAGFPKDEFWLYLSKWRPDVPSVHVLPHWTWPGREGQKIPVYVYSSGDEVELFVNGVSQGCRGRTKNLWRFVFDGVVYQPGELKTVAYRNGKVWCEETVQTAGAPAKLELVSERKDVAADGEDVGYVTVRVCDAQGRTCPTAKIPLNVTVDGGGEFVAAENGDESDFAWFRDPARKTFNGYLSILVRRRAPCSAPITVKVEGGGLAASCSF